MNASKPKVVHVLTKKESDELRMSALSGAEEFERQQRNSEVIKIDNFNCRACGHGKYKVVWKMPETIGSGYATVDGYCCEGCSAFFLDPRDFSVPGIKFPSKEDVMYSPGEVNVKF
ncbi:hypothetical protein COT97_03030 [Candidatus Falkowbacteria bacterium CG10_big_fil_rev_8_21_14_0_10_39_11]|uniref:Uncharacterized protein n=1 Tax=Candidatus Falkowbacteria bacterium CG10_big_fil_rev_8_21_14_0_10_39_11 TaxID=1974565 RepID=A0A2H0V6R9_9BACT|nr:MAG: hypothetical protein COT97_03030 [Candidatus Falkowbacteria bacterium CG10_big_fil_rev_8_21_14_0_10_39_11]